MRERFRFFLRTITLLAASVSFIVWDCPRSYAGEDIAVWRPSTGIWYINRSTDGGMTAIQWGSEANDDVPVPGDYDGDGNADIAVWRPSSGIWYILRSSDGGMTAIQWGAPTDIPVPGYYSNGSKKDLTIYVNGAMGTDEPLWGFSGSKPFATIGYAIQAATLLRRNPEIKITVKIAPGTYSESIALDKNLIWLEGNTADDTIVSGVSTSPVLTVIGQVSIGIKNITLTGGKQGVYCANGSVEITHSVIDNSIESGLYIFSNAAAKVTGSKFIQNGSGIYISNNSSVVIDNSMVSKNTGTGISLWYSSSGIIDNTAVSSNGGTGIQPGAGSSARLTNNIVSNNALIGIDATGHSAVHLWGGNEVFGNADNSGWRSGVGVHHSSHATISAQGSRPADHIYGNHGPGVYAGSNSSVFLPKGVIENNEGDGIGLFLSSIVQVEGNSTTTIVRSNTGYGIRCGYQSYSWIQPGATPDFSGNTLGQTNCP